MATTIDLSGIIAAAAFASADLDTITITTNGVTKTLRQLSGTVTNTTTITVPSYGTFTKAAVGDSTITFTADATYPAGAVTLTPAVGFANFLKTDFSATTAAVEVTGTPITTTVLGGLGADKLQAGILTESIVGGAGDDTITAGVAGGFAAGATVKGGLGADKFVHSAAGIKMNVADYNYAEGDKITLANAFNDGAGTETALSATGAFVDKTGGATVTASAAAADDAYKIKVTDSGAVTREYWTAKTTTSVSLDGTGKTDSLIINAANAVNAQVTLGGGRDLLTLGANTQATVTAGKSGAIDTIAGFSNNTFTGDVLNLKDATLNDVTLGANVKIGTGASETTLTGLGLADDGKILIQENGGAVKKVAYTAQAAGGTITMSDDEAADVYLGYASKLLADKVTLDAGGISTYGHMINLLDTDKYKNITEINGSTITSGSYVGNVNSHDVSGAQGTVFNLVKGSQVWGGSSAADTINLTLANAEKDVVFFGTTDGTDSVTGFKSGFTATDDVLNMYDVADLSTVSFTGATAANVVVKAAAGNTVTLAGATAGNVGQLKLQNQAGTVQKVAVGTASGAAIAIDGVKADVVIGFADGTNTVAYGATQTTDLFVNLFETSKYKNIKNVNLTGSTGSKNTVVGSATLASDVTLVGAATDTWGGSSFANSITGSAGADTIWFGANDGSDTLDGTGAGALGANDKVQFYDKSISELATAYKFTSAVNSTITSTTKATDILTLQGFAAGSFTALDKDNKAAKVVAGTAALTYAADAKVYMADAAGAKQVNVGTTNEVFLYLGNGKDTTYGDVYFSNVTKLDASTSTGKTVLCGAANTADTLTGGSTSSAMWGGGIASDDMVGTASAVDQFWFGKGDGTDKVSAGVDKNDTIVLHNIASIADVTMTVNAGSFVITATDGSTLTVTDATNTAMDGGLTFQFWDGAAKNYTYNKVSKAFVAK